MATKPTTATTEAVTPEQDVESNLLEDRKSVV